MTLSRSVRLNNGVEIPRVGLGVFQSARGEETQSAVREALRLGYRHIDTPRAEVFVTTKLWNDDQGYESALRAFDASLKRLGLEYVDLYLLHWPVPKRRLESWRALESILGDGRVRAIGVSNFMVRHLDELLADAKVLPAVNQIEVSPFLQQRDVRALCDKHGIAVEAYSPLTKGARLRHPVVVRVAERIERSSAQVLLRWGIQRGLIVLPKSTHTERIRENAALFDFDISLDEMSRLDALEEGLVTGWDPRSAP
jgi:diketogulonate reductase-like aldo/keto reductase